MEKDADGFYTPKTADGSRTNGFEYTTRMLIQSVATTKPEGKESEAKEPAKEPAKQPAKEPEVAEATRSGARIKVLSYVAI